MSASHILAINRLVYSGQFMPYWGWHDDHAHVDGTPAYKPAMQQVKSEFAGLVHVLGAMGLLGGKALQLGLGEAQASHSVWLELFEEVTTLDYCQMKRTRLGFAPEEGPGADTHDQLSAEYARIGAPYDFLFIDAGHDFADAKADHEMYGPMVRPGGVIAFHDACPRAAYPEVEVWRYLDTLPGKRMIGTEVGIAWVVA